MLPPILNNTRHRRRAFVASLTKFMLFTVLAIYCFNFKMKCNVKCVEQRRTLPKGHQQSKKRIIMTKNKQCECCETRERIKNTRIYTQHCITQGMVRAFVIILYYYSLQLCLVLLLLLLLRPLFRVFIWQNVQIIFFELIKLIVSNISYAWPSFVKWV